MGISQQIGASSIVRPGVCTSVTRPASPYVGQFIFETDTMTLKYWDGTAWFNAITAVTGSLTSFAGSTAPTGWLLCFGQAVSRTTYSDLFTVISTTYGVGDGSTTFNVPDLRGRAIAGKDDMGGTAASRITSAVTGITGTTLGANGGTQNPPLHSHANTASFTGTAASHGHTIRNPSTGNQIFYMGNGSTGYADQWGQGSQAGLSSGTPIDSTSITPSGSVTMTNANAGTGTSGNVQPTIILNYIIRT